MSATAHSTNNQKDIIDYIDDFRDERQLANGVVLQRSSSVQRLFRIVLLDNFLQRFIDKIDDFSVQNLEYIAFRRFSIANVLDALTDGQLSTFLVPTLLDRNTGAILIGPAPHSQITAINNGDFLVMLSTAISHLFGHPNLDQMSGKYYARFTVTDKDNSDSYLRQGYRRMELHNDGTFVKQITDFVLMMKIDEQNVTGGASLLLHLDDWADCNSFFHHQLASVPMRFSAPASKNIDYETFHPIFRTDSDGRPLMAYIDQFVKPANRLQGTYLQALSTSLETSPCLGVSVPTGSALIINNHFWLHGRDRFQAHAGLRRELLRQRGSFFSSATTAIV